MIGQGRGGPSLVLTATLAAAAGGCGWGAGAAAAPGADPAGPRWVVVETPPAGEGTGAPAGSLVGDGLPTAGSRVVVREGSGAVRVLSEGLASAGDPAVSPDGRRVLFAGRRTPEEALRVYEVGVEGGEATPRTPPSLDAVDPVWIAGDGFAFRGRGRSAGNGEEKNRSKEGGGVPAGAQEREPWSVWVSAGESEGDPVRITYGRAVLDGLAALRDGRLLLAVHGGVREAPRLLVVNTDGTGLAHFAEPTAAARRLHDPRETSQRSIVALAEGAGGQRWLETFPLGRPLPHAGARDPSLRSPAPDGRVAIRAHPAPRGRLSLVKDGESWAELLCLNVNEADPPLGGDRVVSVRISEVAPTPEDGAGNGGILHPLGVAPVAEDGSFFVRVPPDVPLAVELLDEAGTVVRRTEGSFWLRPRERRGCVGCHEDPLLMPVNHRPLAVQSPPVDLSIAARAAGRAP